MVYFNLLMKNPQGTVCFFCSLKRDCPTVILLQIKYLNNNTPRDYYKAPLVHARVPRESQVYKSVL